MNFQEAKEVKDKLDRAGFAPQNLKFQIVPMDIEDFAEHQLAKGSVESDALFESYNGSFGVIVIDDEGVWSEYEQWLQANNHSI